MKLCLFPNLCRRNARTPGDAATQDLPHLERPPFHFSSLDAFHIFDLKEKGGGGLFATRPTLNDYIVTRKELVSAADATFSAFLDDKFKIQINHVYALKDARRAHEELEARKTTGAGILVP